MTVETSQNSAPKQAAAASLAVMTMARRGVARNVAVAVWWANSLVMTSTPMSMAKSTPRNWPEVIMFAAMATWPEFVRARAAWAMAWALAAPVSAPSGG